MFTVTPIPAFNDNYIWAISVPGNPEIAVVDPGDAEPVNRYLSANKLQLSTILITHHHNDHTGGVEQLSKKHQAAVFGPANSPFKGIQHPLQDGDSVSLLGQQLAVKSVPGHTLDHISYLLNGTEPQIFCGDTLFLAGCGRLFEGTPAQMFSAMEYFNHLPDSTEIYCTHEYSLANLEFAAAVEPGNSDISDVSQACQQRRNLDQPTLPTTMAQEKRINPFLRYRSDEVRQSAERFSGNILASECDVFATVREWKNQF